MKNINLKDVELSYFLSTGELVKHSYEEGTVFIKGENRSKNQKKQKNGCGKTVIFLDAVLYALYGSVSREKFTQKDIPYNKGGKKKCIVKLTLDVVVNGEVTEVVITRTINPSKLTLFVNGEDKTQSHSSSTQEFITDNILSGIKIDVFKQSLAMDINKTNNFLSMSKIEREKFIGGVFDLEYIKAGQKLVREDYNKLSKETEVVNGRVKMVNGYITSTKEKIDRTKLLVGKEQVEKEQQFKNLQDNLSKVEKSIEEFDVGTKPTPVSFEEESASIDKLVATIDAKNTTHTQNVSNIKNDIRSSTSEIARLDKLIKRDEAAKVCPTCKRDVDQECLDELTKANDERRTEIKALSDKIEIHKTDLTATDTTEQNIAKLRQMVKVKKDALVGKVNKSREEEAAYNKRLSLLQQLESKRDSLVSQIEQGVQPTTQGAILESQESELETLTTDLEKETTEFDKKVEELEVLNHVKSIFGENGIKEVILGRIVDLFNKTVNTYLERLEVPVRLVFDSAFQCVMTSLAGDELPIGGLSGGERVRVSTALAFTFKDILRIQNQIAFNISIYDEWFDVSVDARGLEVMGEILQERLDSYNESAYIITHRTELVVDNSKTITVIKENGQSRIAN